LTIGVNQFVRISLFMRYSFCIALILQWLLE